MVRWSVTLGNPGGSSRSLLQIYGGPATLLGHTQRKWKQGLKQISVHPQSEQHLTVVKRWQLKFPWIYGNVAQTVLWNTTQPSKGRKFGPSYNLDEPMHIMPSEISQPQRMIIINSPYEVI